MADVNKSEAIQKIIKGLRLDAVREEIPKRVANAIVPTYQTNDTSNIKIITDLTLNDVDKTFTVPTNKHWKVISIHVSNTTTATVGNRTMVFTYDDSSGNVMWQTNALNVQTASTTETYRVFTAPTFANESQAGFHSLPIPTDFIIPAGGNIHVFHASEIDALDDMLVVMQVKEYDTDEFPVLE